jgi:hypothetical protein
MLEDSQPPHITTTTEGSGYVLTCECLWTRFCPTRLDMRAQRVVHRHKCKGPKVEKAKHAPRAPHAATWDDREGATWIDKL